MTRAYLLLLALVVGMPAYAAGVNSSASRPAASASGETSPSGSGGGGGSRDVAKRHHRHHRGM